MPEEKKWKKLSALKKKEVFKSGRNLKGELVGDRTIINLRAFTRHYKLEQAYANVHNLKYRSDRPIKIQIFREYFNLYKHILELGFKAKEKPRPQFPPDEAYRNTMSNLHYPKGRLLVLVDKAIYNDVSASIDQYVLDVGRDGYWATIHVVNGGKPADIRSYIQEFRPVGVLLVGAIPAPWYEIDSDQFPCDLYYMDINGTWSDPDGNGKFNGHDGNLDPEIWVGRIWTPTEHGNDASIINDYFARNHKFRLGMLGHARSALAYVDDDWQGFGDCAFDEQFPPSEITVYNNPTITDADLYKAEINSLRSWAQLCAHSWVQGHALKVGSANEYIQMPYFRDINPPNAHFYNLFCCGPGKFTTSNYLAGWYIFDKAGGGKNLGLATIASAKSGSMLFFEDFYRPLGQGKVIGDAFVEWWQARGPIHEDWERYWFYGLVLLGDPTLTWWKSAVPQLEQPQKEDVFDHWPRKMQLRWDPVNISGVKYSVEIDAFGAVNAGKWAEETNQTFAIYHNISTYTFDHTFVGMQRGRWRVRAKIDGQNCSWSPWSYFKFTI